MHTANKIEKLGSKGEDLAASFLEDRGYCILERNYRVKIGEIDIIAKDNDTYCFVEVKTRKTRSRGSALESIADYKQHKLSKIALWYLQSKNLFDVKVRFDVVAIQLRELEPPEISFIKDAFDCKNYY